METKRFIKVTAGNLRQNHIYINEHRDFFPADCIGTSRKIKNGDTSTVEIILEGLNMTIKTDIGREASNGRPRRFLRGRSWVRQFFSHHGIKPGDLLALERIAERRYLLRPGATSVDVYANSCCDQRVNHSVVDLFAGAGGLSLGFKRAGFELIAAFENWPAAVESYRRNIGEHVVQASITADLEFPECSVIIGGPPCQGFSSAGLRRTDDTRNSLVRAFSTLIANRSPRAFVFENVEGFLTGTNGASVFELLDPLVDAGYRIHLRKINAANFGVPQHRKRVIAIGGLGWDPSFPEPTHAAYGAPGAHRGNKMGAALTPTVADSLRSLQAVSLSQGSRITDHVIESFTGDDLLRAKLLQPGHRMRDLPEELWHSSYRRRAFRRVKDGTPTERRGGAPSGIRRLRADEPSKAITSGALHEFIHPTEDRPLTIRECAVLQTFPLEFEFTGTQRERIQLIGNAVPPRLAEVIANSLKSDLDRNPTARAKNGCLLTFVPTLAEGMSPALERVTHRVIKRYGAGHDVGNQRLLWH